ncbi:MAG: TrkH family potassium uptake protein [Spirochaetales bacterium]|nr:TrkH family potassium uptake protein [Spirochaetales bacterium]
MNWRQILRLLGTIQAIIGVFMAIPTAMALYYGEMEAFKAFIFTLVIIVIYVVVILTVGRAWKERSLTIRDVYLFVTLSWIVASLLGAIPLYRSGATNDYTSAFMEVMSGFTTTGLTNIASVDGVARSILFWRSLTHWLGGMGIVVLFVALLPLIGVEGFQLFGAEAVGPTKSKLTPKMKNTALILWLIYIAITLLQTLLLLLGGVGLYDALTITFGTVATGGFSATNNSIASYASSYVEIITTIFMVLAGVNFSLYFALVRKKFSEVWRDGELKVYLAIYFIATLVVTLSLLGNGSYTSFGTSLRYGAFQSASIMTTTGFASASYNSWPPLAQGVLLLLMFTGASAGSTSGGIKVTRLITLFKLGRQNVKSLLHPRGVFTIQSEEERIPWHTVNAIAGFIALYLALVLASTLVVASAGYDLLTAFTSGLCCVGNIGLGLGGIAPGEVGFTAMPHYVKWFLSFMMLAGRLEIYTVLALFTPTFWKH